MLQKFLSRNFSTSARSLLLIGLLALTVFGLMLMFTQSSANIKPRADDYCFIDHYEDLNVLGNHIRYFSLSNGRIGSHVVITGMYYFGQGLLTILPIIWFGALNALLVVLGLKLRKKTKKPRPQKDVYVLTGLSIVSTMTMYIALSTTYQNLFWAPGLVTYASAMIGYLALIAWSLRTSSSREKWLGIIFFSMFAGLVGELSTILALTAIAAMLAVRLFEKRSITKTVRTSKELIVVAAIQLSAFILMYTSPGTTLRRNRSSDRALGFSEAVSDSLERTTRELELVFWQPTTWILLAVALVGVVVLRAYADGLQQKIASLRHSKSYVALAHLFAIFTLFFTFFLNNFATGFVAKRTLYFAVLIIFIVLLLDAVLLVRALLNSKRSFVAPVTIALIVFASWHGFDRLISRYAILDLRIEQHAVAWDARDARLRPLGADDSVIDQRLELGFIADLQPNNPSWVNECIADFYEIEAITPHVPN